MTETEMLVALDRFATFERGWDSYDGDPIKAESWRVARLLVPVLAADSPYWHVVPCSDGSIQFECSANGVDVEFEIMSELDSDT